MVKDGVERNGNDSAIVRVRFLRLGYTGPAFVAVTVQHEATAKAQAGHIEIVLPGRQRIYVTAPVARQALAGVLVVLAAAGPERQEGQPC